MSDYLKKRERERELEKIRGKAKKVNRNGSKSVSKTELKRLAKQIGSGDFFHPDVMRSFNSRLESEGWRLGDGSIVFLTSEAFDAEGQHRVWSVRHMAPGVKIRTHKGGLAAPGKAELETRKDAMREVRELLAKKSQAV